jgi:hypothetical protein
MSTLPFSNHTFVVLHLVLQGMVYTEYTCEIFGYCQDLEFSLYYLLLPYLLLMANLVFFTLTCFTNPGKWRLLAQTGDGSAALLIVLQISSGPLRRLQRIPCVMFALPFHFECFLVLL